MQKPVEIERRKSKHDITENDKFTRIKTTSNEERNKGISKWPENN